MEYSDYTTKNNSGKFNYRGACPLNMYLDSVTKPVFIKRGFAQSRIITDWPKIVGDIAATQSVPRKLTFKKGTRSNGTLYIEISNSGFATEFVYLEPVILEKISCYFGYKAVSKLKIIQNPQMLISKTASHKQHKSLSETKQKSIDELLKDIDDPKLKESLKNLGTEILSN